MRACSSTEGEWQSVFAWLKPQLTELGFDLSAPFISQRYNRSLAGQAVLPTFGRQSTFGVVVANSKHLWPSFIEYLAEDPKSRLENSEHPLNDYVKETITALVDSLPIQKEIRYPDDKGDKFVHFQPLCHLAGLAFYNRVRTLP